jgi:hypothetical protein
MLLLKPFIFNLRLDYIRMWNPSYFKNNVFPSESYYFYSLKTGKKQKNDPKYTTLTQVWLDQVLVEIGLYNRVRTVYCL